MASEEYIQTLRRVQANIGYLMPKAQHQSGGGAEAGGGGKQPPGPAHMTPPAHMVQGEVGQKYERLREVFPDWHGFAAARGGSQGGSAGSPQAGGNGIGNGNVNVNVNGGYTPGAGGQVGQISTS